MIDPITISAVVGGAKALKGAFDMAKEAMQEFRECAEAGMDAGQSMGALIKVFTAQGEAQKEINKAKEAKVKAVADDGSPVEPEQKKSATVIALEAMQYERELRQQEEEIKHYLIYQCNESGLYQELCERRNEIINAEKAEEEERRRIELEAILERKRIELAKRREAERRVEMVMNSVTVILGSGVSALLIYGIYWMLHYKG